MTNVLDFKHRLPAPTRQDPLCQLEWIFRDKISLYSNDDTINNYANALAFYKRFLKQTNNFNEGLRTDPRFFISKEWDVFALLKVKRWLDQTNEVGSPSYLTSYTVTSNVSALRQTMEHAYEHSYIEKPIINVVIPSAVRETAVLTAYSANEYEQIFKVIAPKITFAKALLEPYVRTGLGRDPRVLTRKGLTFDQKPLGQGWNCWTSTDVKHFVPQEDNMRWYFENEMNCVALPATPENSLHNGFFRTAKQNVGGLKELYRRWGLSSTIDTEVIMPLVVALIAETGLNVQSLLSLKRDCFKEAHPLTGLPYLEYYKPRSTGDKELHISLYDRPDQMGLQQAQSRVISNTIKIILKLTDALVEHAPEKDRQFLFLSQRNRRTDTGGVGRVERVSLKIAGVWLNKMVRIHHLRGDDGQPLLFTLSRFRPTKITDMVSQGYDFFHIMAVAGHSSITTTLSYIDKLKSAGDFHLKMQDALSRIRENKLEYERNPLPIAITRTSNPSNFVFKGPVCHCKNPYDPPDLVRRSHGYHEGDACSYWNMCLQCDNVLITEMNLPKLIAFRNEIENALGNLNEIPRLGELYKKMKMILDTILIPGELFSADTIAWATQVALTTDFEILNAFVSRGVEA